MNSASRTNSKFQRNNSRKYTYFYNIDFSLQKKTIIKFGMTN